MLHELLTSSQCLSKAQVSTVALAVDGRQRVINNSVVVCGLTAMGAASPQSEAPSEGRERGLGQNLSDI